MAWRNTGEYAEVGNVEEADTWDSLFVGTVEFY